jgi:hypothetical protein
MTVFFTDGQQQIKPAVSLTQAMSDVNLLGGPFKADSFWTWKTVAKLIDGLPLDEREAELCRQCTGRSQLPSGAVRRLVVLVGRRGGKDRFLSAVAVWRAALCADWRQHVSSGEQAVVMLLGADKKQAAILRRYCQGLLQAPLLAAEVTRQTDDVIEFRDGGSLEVATNNAALVRGRSAIAVLGSEASYWKTDEYAASSDEEVVAAAEPSMAMCPDGGLLLLGSSVYRKRGFMFRMFKKLHGNDEAEDICWLAPSATMNPRLRSAVVDRALADDAPRARAEYLGVWRDDVCDFIPVDVIEAATDFGVRERAPLLNTKYIAFCDSAGGTGSDAFTLAVAHREGDNAVLDLLRERKPRFVPAAVVAEYAGLLKAYGITEVQSDKYAGGFHSDEWRRHDIKFIACERTTSENYLAALPLLLAGRARLLDNATLRSQLVGLERQVHANARESVTHGNTRGHDDLSCAAAGALVIAGGRPRYDSLFTGWDDAPLPGPLTTGRRDFYGMRYIS